MPSPLEVRDWHELDVVSSDGQSVGKLIDVYVNNESGEPEFLLVASGFMLGVAPGDSAPDSLPSQLLTALAQLTSSTEHCQRLLSYDEP